MKRITVYCSFEKVIIYVWLSLGSTKLYFALCKVLMVAPDSLSMSEHVSA